MSLFHALSAALLLAVAGQQAHAVDFGRATGAVVKLFVAHQAWNPKQPWSKESTARRTCSGFFIDQGILTNAHCVMDATFIQVEVPGIPDKITARRVAVNHQVDLALVEPTVPVILPPGIEPIRFGDLPAQRETVVTVGYSVGGRQVSFTEGVVSRIDVMPYAHSNLANLLVQTDAAINRGNSGGPVFSELTGECLGVATQRYSGSIGYFIPVPVIRQFLADLEDGNVNGVPYLGIHYQALENPTLREYLGMTSEQSGARVSMVARGGSGDQELRKDDVLMAVEGTQIFNDGRIPFREYGRIGLGYEISTRQVGEKVTFRVLRDGEVIDVDVSLVDRDPSIIPSQPLYDEQPPYLVAGGLLFRTVEPAYLGKDVPFNLRSYFGALRGEDDIEEVVVISAIHEADLNRGYDSAQENVRVMTINDQPIRRLEDVAAAITGHDGAYHVIELDNRHLVVLDSDQLEGDEQMIRRRYRIP